MGKAAKQGPDLKEILFKATFGHNECHLRCSRENWFSPLRVMLVARPPAEDSNPEPKRDRMEIRPILSFSDEDKVGTIQPHDDALVVTLRIRGYDVKRVLVN